MTRASESQTYYRVQDGKRDPKSLLSPDSVSHSWDNPEHVQDRGTSVMRSREELAEYLAKTGIPFGEGGWVMLELEGEDLGPGRDNNERLIQATKVKSVNPIDDEFFDMVGAAHDRQAGQTHLAASPNSKPIFDAEMGGPSGKLQKLMDNMTSIDPDPHLSPLYGDAKWHKDHESLVSGRHGFQGGYEPELDEGGGISYHRGGVWTNNLGKRVPVAHVIKPVLGLNRDKMTPSDPDQELQYFAVSSIPGDEGQIYRTLQDAATRPSSLGNRWNHPGRGRSPRSLSEGFMNNQGDKKTVAAVVPGDPQHGLGTGHTAPGVDNPTFDDPENYLPDVYEHPEYYVSPFDRRDPRVHRSGVESHRALLAARGNPDAQVKIYRAVPHGITEIEGHTNPAGASWVSPSPTYAERHADAESCPSCGGDMQVISGVARAGDLHNEGYLEEWGYTGDPIRDDSALTECPEGAHEARKEAERRWLDNREASVEAPDTGNSDFDWEEAPPGRGHPQDRPGAPDPVRKTGAIEREEVENWFPLGQMQDAQGRNYDVRVGRGHLGSYFGQAVDPNVDHTGKDRDNDHEAVIKWDPHDGDISWRGSAASHRGGLLSMFLKDHLTKKLSGNIEPPKHSENLTPAGRASLESYYDQYGDPHGDIEPALNPYVPYDSYDPDEEPEEEDEPEEDENGRQIIPFHHSSSEIPDDDADFSINFDPESAEALERFQQNLEESERAERLFREHGEDYEEASRRRDAEERAEYDQPEFPGATWRKLYPNKGLDLFEPARYPGDTGIEPWQGSKRRVQQTKPLIGEDVDTINHELGVPKRSLSAAIPDESGIKAAGIAVIAMDTGRVLMQQRALNPMTCPCGQGVTWDESNGYQHEDGSVSHDGEFYGQSVSDLLDQGHPELAKEAAFDRERGEFLYDIHRPDYHRSDYPPSFDASTRQPMYQFKDDTHSDNPREDENGFSRSVVLPMEAWTHGPRRPCAVCNYPEYRGIHQDDDYENYEHEYVPSTDLPPGERLAAHTAQGHIEKTADYDDSRDTEDFLRRRSIERNRRLNVADPPRNPTHKGKRMEVVWPTTPEGWCNHYRYMDSQYGVDRHGKPYGYVYNPGLMGGQHHDQVCPVHKDEYRAEDMAASGVTASDVRRMWSEDPETGSHAQDESDWTPGEEDDPFYRGPITREAALEFDPNEGTWEFPGGKLDEGESPRAAAMREFREEVGQDLPPGVFVGAWVSPGGIVVSASAPEGPSAQHQRDLAALGWKRVDPYSWNLDDPQTGTQHSADWDDGTWHLTSSAPEGWGVPQEWHQLSPQAAKDTEDAYRYQESEHDSPEALHGQAKVNSASFGGLGEGAAKSLDPKSHPLIGEFNRFVDYTPDPSHEPMHRLNMVVVEADYHSSPDQSDVDWLTNEGSKFGWREYKGFGGGGHFYDRQLPDGTMHAMVWHPLDGKWGGEVIDAEGNSVFGSSIPTFRSAMEAHAGLSDAYGSVSNEQSRNVNRANKVQESNQGYDPRSTVDHVMPDFAVKEDMFRRLNAAGTEEFRKRYPTRTVTTPRGYPDNYTTWTDSDFPITKRDVYNGLDQPMVGMREDHDSYKLHKQDGPACSTCYDDHGSVVHKSDHDAWQSKWNEHEFSPLLPGIGERRFGSARTAAGDLPQRNQPNPPEEHLKALTESGWRMRHPEQSRSLPDFTKLSPSTGITHMLSWGRLGRPGWHYDAMVPDTNDVGGFRVINETDPKRAMFGKGSVPVSGPEEANKAYKRYERSWLMGSPHGEDGVVHHFDPEAEKELMWQRSPQAYERTREGNPVTGTHPEPDVSYVDFNPDTHEHDEPRENPRGGLEKLNSVTAARKAPVYKGFIYLIQNERDIDLSMREHANPDDPDGDMSEQSAWWDIEHARKNPALRKEVKQTPWAELELWADKSVRNNKQIKEAVSKLAAGKTKCMYCKERSTKEIIHSEGMARIPVCGAHLSKGKTDAANCTPDGSHDPSNIDSIKSTAGTQAPSQKVFPLIRDAITAGRPEFSLRAPDEVDGRHHDMISDNSRPVYHQEKTFDPTTPNIYAIRNQAAKDYTFLAPVTHNETGEDGWLRGRAGGDPSTWRLYDDTDEGVQMAMLGKHPDKVRPIPADQRYIRQRATGRPPLEEGDVPLDEQGHQLVEPRRDRWSELGAIRGFADEESPWWVVD